MNSELSIGYDSLEKVYVGELLFYDILTWRWRKKKLEEKLNT